MIFNKHSAYEGQHAFLGASKYHWLNYDEHKIVEAYLNYLAKQRGTTLHAFASECIKLRQKLARKNKTLNMYVNDAIDDRMTPEQVLYYSDNCFGTADALGFSDDILRIYDLKVVPVVTGIHVINAGGNKENVYYDLHGRKVVGNPTVKGIYINGRKKVLKK